MKEFRDKDGLLNRVYPAKVWTRDGCYNTVKVRYAEPHPEIDPELPFGPVLLAEPSKMPETEAEFLEMMASGCWVLKERCLFDHVVNAYHIMEDVR